MKFTFEEFEIEEIQGLGVQEKDALDKIAQGFSNEEHAKKVYELLNSDCTLTYIIKDARTKELEKVGEITFSDVETGEPEIGVGIEEKYRRKGIAYRVIKELINKLHRERGINSYTYKVLSYNTESKGLVEKLGGEIIKKVDGPKELGVSFIKYRISLG